LIAMAHYGRLAYWDERYTNKKEVSETGWRDLLLAVHIGHN